MGDYVITGLLLVQMIVFVTMQVLVELQKRKLKEAQVAPSCHQVIISLKGSKWAKIKWLVLYNLEPRVGSFYWTSRCLWWLWRHASDSHHHSNHDCYGNPGSFLSRHKRVQKAGNPGNYPHNDLHPVQLHATQADPQKCQHEKIYIGKTEIHFFKRVAMALWQLLELPVLATTNPKSVSKYHKKRSLMIRTPFITEKSQKPTLLIC